MLENSAKLFVIGLSTAWIILLVIGIGVTVVTMCATKKHRIDNAYDDEIDDFYDNELDRQTQLDHAAAIRDDGRFV